MGGCQAPLTVPYGAQKTVAFSSSVFHLRSGLGLRFLDCRSPHRDHFRDFPWFRGRDPVIFHCVLVPRQNMRMRGVFQKAVGRHLAPFGRRIAPVAARARSGHPPGSCALGAAPLAGRFN